MKIDELTPVEYYEEEGIWLKRDDLFEICGVRGGKARSAYQVITELIEEGHDTIVTAGSRQSPQCEIVSFICESLGVRCKLFMPFGGDTSVISNIKNNPNTEIIRVRPGYNNIIVARARESLGVRCKLFMPFGGDTSVISNIKNNPNTEIIRVRPGYNNIIVARAREYAENRNCGYVPFGMECEKNVEVTSKQVQNIPDQVKRIVIPVGSGMSFSSVVTGMLRYSVDKPILGVRVGKDPTKIIQEYAVGLDFLDWDIVESSVDYHTDLEEYVGDYRLDPIYEAKCREFLKEGDLLWVVGKRVM